jgi:hypothetical protein
MSETRKCTNCAFCQRFKYSPKDPDSEQMMRCWQRPSVCDHAYVRKLSEAEKEQDVCDEHMFKEEREAQLYEKAKCEYASHLKSIKELEEKYPDFKDIDWTQIEG